MSVHVSSFQNLVLLFTSVAAAALMTGCSNMVPTAGSTNTFTSLGTSGYGSAGTLLATTTSLDDGAGSFQFSQVAGGGTGPSGNSYTCPSSDALLYHIASGGSTDGVVADDNSAAVFLATVGACGTAASAFIDMNEVTTVGMVWALQQYINPGATTGGTASVGSPNTTQARVGITNAFATVGNLVNLANGTPIASSTLTGTAATVNGTAVSVFVEADKINTIANILASCVNNPTSSADNCTKLFANATAPSPALTSQPSATFPIAGNTLQAAYYMATNPTDGSSTNMGNLWDLQAAIGAPFQTAMSSQPTDWTIGIDYRVGSASCTGSASGLFISNAYTVRADADGNIWISSNSAAPANISEVSPTGVPMACVTPSSSVGMYEGLSIDTSGNIWAAAHSGNGGIYRIDPNTLAVRTWSESGSVPRALEADGQGNVFYTVASKPVHEFVSAATAVSPAASLAIGDNISATPNFLTISPSGSLWTGGQNTTAYLYQTYPDAGGTNGYTANHVGTGGNIEGQIAVDAAGRVWTDQSTINTVTVFVPNATAGSAATASITTAASAGGINTPRGLAIDGAGNAWVANGGANSGLNAISEFDSNGNALSGSGGYGKESTVFTSTLRGAAIDPSGNVWMGTNGNANQYEELVGAAVPVVTPLSAQLAPVPWPGLRFVLGWSVLYFAVAAGV